MNEAVKTAQQAARAFYEAEQALDAAKEALMPYAKQQAEITKKVADELGLRSEYTYRPYFGYSWIELEIGGYYEGSSDIPVIECNLWYRGRCGDSDSIEDSFTLNQHILNGEPEKFEAELRGKLETESQKKARQDRERKEREIARLQTELNRLQEQA